MRASENISKCLECGYVDEARKFSVLVAVETYVRLCPHCRAGESDLLHDLKDYVLRSVSGSLRVIQTTVVINNEFGHYAIADRITGTRLSTWGSHAHALDEFRSTELKVRRLAGEHETRGQALETGVNNTGERRCIARAGTDRRLFNLPVPVGPRSSGLDLTART